MELITQQIIRSENLRGKGYVDFETIFAKLKAANNNSPFSVEIEFTQAGPKDLAEINTAVQDSAEYLKAHGFAL